MKPAELTKARLFGTVAADGIKRPEDAMGVSFTLVDKDQAAKTIRVDFKGAVPDTFKPGAEVIVEGGVNPASGDFAANTLMTKCPSKKTYKGLAPGIRSGAFRGCGARRPALCPARCGLLSRVGFALSPRRDALADRRGAQAGMSPDPSARCRPCGCGGASRLRTLFA